MKTIPPYRPFIPLGFAALNWDGLAYHLQQQRNDGWFTMGYVPPGHYFVETYLQYGASAQARKQLSKWRMAKQEVEIKADADIVLKLEPAN